MEGRWDIEWRDRQGRVQPLAFELGRGLRYRVVICDEQDKEHFLQTLLRPPHTALLAPDGGLLGNLKLDENLLLPLSYRGPTHVPTEQRVIALFERCGLDAMQTSQLLSRLPHQISPYQRRLVGFVRSMLMEPAMLVYTAIWHGVTESERQQLLGFDAILRRELPACTSVFVDYDNTLEDVLPAQKSYYL
ncbi:MAG: hypothetical protein ABL873_00230 [Gallionella sp.]